MRSGKRRVHFGILGAAAIVLLSIFLLNGTEQVVPSERTVVTTSETAAAPVASGEVLAGLPGEVPATLSDDASNTEGAGTTSSPSGSNLVSPDPDEDAHPGVGVDQKLIHALHGNEPLNRHHPHMASAIEIQERHTEDLMANPAVVGTAIGLNDKGQVAMVVYTKAEVKDIPNVIEELPVVIRQSGEFFARIPALTQEAAKVKGDDSAQAKPSGRGGKGGRNSVDPTARFERPVPIGVSTGHPDITAGTIGCRVTDGANVYALSNNHVYADVNAAAPGDAVIQPGTFDGGTSPADDIGTLDDSEPIDFAGPNVIDAAIALSDVGDLGNGTPSNGYGVPKSATLEAAIGDKVLKYGRTTGQKEGTIGAINASVNVNYGPPAEGGPDRIALFVNQIVITPGTFSSGGDSGSLIVRKQVEGKGKKKTDGPDHLKPVGLLYAGSSFDTIANPIDDVLSRFGVTIDGR